MEPGNDRAGVGPGGAQATARARPPSTAGPCNQTCGLRTFGLARSRRESPATTCAGRQAGPVSTVSAGRKGLGRTMTSSPSATMLPTSSRSGAHVSTALRRGWRPAGSISGPAAASRKGRTPPRRATYLWKERLPITAPSRPRGLARRGTRGPVLAPGTPCGDAGELRDQHPELAPHAGRAGPLLGGT